MGYTLKQFFAHHAGIYQEQGNDELARLLLRLGEYADGVTKLLGSAASSEVVYEMLKENLVFEAEFYDTTTVQHARDLLDSFFVHEA